MRRVFELLVILSVFISFISVRADELISLNSSLRDEQVPLSKTVELLDELYKTRGDKPLLIFVHGRGQHPLKGLGLIKSVEELFNVNVVMFHWPSWSGVLIRPEQSAKDASSKFAVFLRELSIWRDSNLHIKATLLVHSMGGIVLENYVRNYSESGLDGLFNNLVLTSPDSPYKDHRDWIDNVYFAEDSYLVFNRHDGALAISKMLDILKGKKPYKRLGMAKLTLETMGQKIKYIDLTKVAFLGHRHYLTKNKGRKKPVYRFFKRALEGEHPFLDSDHSVYNKKVKNEYPENSFYIKGKR